MEHETIHAADLLGSFFVAFSMYSKIPVPNVRWNKKNMRYALCFFPLIGVVCGICFWLLGKLCVLLSLGRVLRGILLAILPIAVTGGIHMDGFMDTCDALASWGDKEKKLQILKDPHVGAFAVIGCVCYMLLLTGILSEMPTEAYGICGTVFVMSRALSGLGVVSIPSAKEEGTLREFQENAGKKAVRIVMLLWIAAAVILSVALGGRQIVGLAAGMMVSVFCYLHICRKHFGGTTGDLAGFFLESAELLMFAGILILSLM